MSILFNQTNVAPGTSFSGGGGGGNITVESVAFTPVLPNITVLSDTISAVPLAYGTATMLGVSQGGTTIGNFRVGDYLEVQEQGAVVALGLNRTQYGAEVIKLIQKNTGTPIPLAQINTTTNDSWALTNISTINGTAPALAGSGPKTLYGTVAFSTNGQTITFSEAFATNPAVFLQATGNGAGVNGSFQVNNAATYKTAFQIFYSGELIYGPIEMNWMAVGT